MSDLLKLHRETISDIQTVCRFILDCYPTYEDNINWEFADDPEEQWFYDAALRLNKALSLGIKEGS